MPSFDARGMDPEVIAELDAIDATLAGEPVDPAHAELAELALLLAATSPRPTREFAADLDRRVARRFAPVAGSGSRAGTRRGRARAGGGVGRLRTRLFSPWGAGPAFALVAAGVAVVVILGSGGFGSGSTTVTRPLGAVSHPITTHSYGDKNGATSGLSATSGSVRAPAKAFPPASAKSRAASSATTATNDGVFTTSSSAGAVAASPPAASETPAPLPGTTGKVVQSASISLTTPNVHVDQVSQEVYNVVGVENGTVTNSQITAATVSNGGGYASFTLSFPTANLQAAMTALSRLRFAAVASRTDGTQNVGGQYNADQASLQQAQALRTSLLKQLEAADTQTAIDAIEAQLKTADAQIASAQSTLASLQHKISYSTVSVQINSGGIVIVNPTNPTPQSGFTISRAGHDALRVLVVSLGVGLIALAVLVPLSLVVALIAWAALLTRRRRREHALDAA